MVRRVGLTGGIGAGKSAVARIFAELGAFIINTDTLARQAVSPNSDGLLAIAHEWPQVVRNGALDRGALAEIVFTDSAARERLNAIVHPFVRRLANDAAERAAPGQLVVDVVPLLFETGYVDLVDKSIVVIAPVEERIKRVIARDGGTEQGIRARMAAQIDPAEAARLADYVIENDGNFEHLRERVEALYRELR
jgi:dephospho-CoA kinase